MTKKLTTQKQNLAIKPVSYGRQHKNKTQKSVALSKEKTEWAQEQANKHGISFSAYIEELIAKAMNSQ
jgi:predicted DNA binding CopG/RHH family protein